MSFWNYSQCDILWTPGSMLYSNCKSFCLNDAVQCTHLQDKAILFQCCNQTAVALKLFKTLVWHAPIAANIFSHMHKTLMKFELQGNSHSKWATSAFDVRHELDLWRGKRHQLPSGLCKQGSKCVAYLAGTQTCLTSSILYPTVLNSIAIT